MTGATRYTTGLLVYSTCLIGDLLTFFGTVACLSGNPSFLGPVDGRTFGLRVGDLRSPI